MKIRFQLIDGTKIYESDESMLQVPSVGDYHSLPCHVKIGKQPTVSQSSHVYYKVLSRWFPDDSSLVIVKCKSHYIEANIDKIKENKDMSESDDLKFLKEMKGHAIKWDEKRDTNSRDYLFRMIDDWIDELKEN